MLKNLNINLRNMLAQNRSIFIFNIYNFYNDAVKYNNNLIQSCNKKEITKENFEQNYIKNNELEKIKELYFYYKNLNTNNISFNYLNKLDNYKHYLENNYNNTYLNNEIKIVYKRIESLKLDNKISLLKDIKILLALGGYQNFIKPTYISQSDNSLINKLYNEAKINIKDYNIKFSIDKTATITLSSLLILFMIIPALLFSNNNNTDEAKETSNLEVSDEEVPDNEDYNLTNYNNEYADCRDSDIRTTQTKGIQVFYNKNYKKIWCSSSTGYNGDKVKIIFRVYNISKNGYLGFVEDKNSPKLPIYARGKIIPNIELNDYLYVKGKINKVYEYESTDKEEVKAVIIDTQSIKFIEENNVSSILKEIQKKPKKKPKKKAKKVNKPLTISNQEYEDIRKSYQVYIEEVESMPIVLEECYDSYDEYSDIQDCALEVLDNLETSLTSLSGSLLIPHYDMQKSECQKNLALADNQVNEANDKNNKRTLLNYWATDLSPNLNGFPTTYLNEELIYSIINFNKIVDKFKLTINNVLEHCK